jgi:hypothetical protein
MAQSKEKKGAAGAIVGLVAAAAIGTYFLYGAKGASSNRKKVKGWMLKAKGEILEKLEKAQEVSAEGYDMAVAQVMKKYEAMKEVDANDVAAFVADLKKHWKEAKGGAKKSVKKSK